MIKNKTLDKKLNHKCFYSYKYKGNNNYLHKCLYDGQCEQQEQGSEKYNIKQCNLIFCYNMLNTIGDKVDIK